MPLERLAAVLLCFSITLGQRMTIATPGSQIDPSAVAFVLVAALLWVRDSDVPRSPYRAVALNTVGPLLALLALYTVLGVIVFGGDYKVTTLANLMLPAYILAVLSLARAQRVHGLRLVQYGYVAVLIQGLYGLGQMANRLGLLPGGLWGWATAWDVRSYATSTGDPSLVDFTRSTGLFVNANLFGLWSALAVVFAAAYLEGRKRTIAAILGVLGVVGSQSRTAWAALIILAVLVAVRALRDSRTAGRVVGWLLALVPVAAIGLLLGWFPRLIEGGLIARLVSGSHVIGGGAAADQNFGARWQAWGQAIDFSQQYPFGTLGQPGRVFGGFIDNEYVNLFLQGSVVLVAAYVFALLSPLVLARRGVPNAGALGAAAFVVAVSSITMQPLEALGASSLVWLMAAVSLGSPVSPGLDHADEDDRLKRVENAARR